MTALRIFCDKLISQSRRNLRSTMSDAPRKTDARVATGKHHYGYRKPDAGLKGCDSKGGEQESSFGSFRKQPC